MKKFVREHGLSIVWLSLFVVFMAGQTVFGFTEYNDDQREHGRSEVTYAEYLRTGHFVEATTENWESEFLQMFLFVTLTAILYQRGSAESKKLYGYEPVDRDPRRFTGKRIAPWPVRRGGTILRIYENSLSLAFLILFLACFALHAASGARQYNEEQAEHGSSEQVSTIQYLSTSRFWFESFQNWQSEFLAVGTMVAAIDLAAAKRLA